MLIRSAILDDVPAVLVMLAKTCALHETWDAAKYGLRSHPEQYYEKWLTRLLHKERSVFLVAEDEDKLVAFLVATVEPEISIYSLQEFAFIHDLWVEPEYRRKGIAPQIIKLTVERFQQMGVKQIRLDTVAANDSARELFKSCGFRVSTIEMLREI
ncbi:MULTISPECIES: GNAT family N-acetyltransferase [unclassified Nodularia (in: cyanobacteria)]|uniref:GNAT family N-acetyltransferase n=1 Tax=unclassified Nodularia (in: cyanobacteria) TaxID=2656917 RepID=UPI00188157D9|nr:MULTISPECIES: GNAT family N-acetyltransferase [unclassified Nodularia (in: cyanobacteria)]MBE9197965.1 GNAT family N-acetyltransferase [Nodularia sp. LEGE 06071]MCC2691729.1 GNAT family N-acetyltransferase [Nodularia sp. LEGE 04288]